MSGTQEKRTASNAQAAGRQQRTEPKVVETGKNGFVKWFNVKLGYGFVSSNDGKQDYFLHRTNISKPNPAHLIASVAEEEPIQFDIAEGRKGLEAINVRGIDGGAVKGFQYAPRVTARIPPLWAVNLLPAAQQPSRHYGQKVTSKFTEEQGVRRRVFVMSDRWTEDGIIEHQVLGTVKFFDFRRGFGFIVRDDNQESVYVHRTSIMKPNPIALLESLADGEHVRFDIHKVKDRIEAINVTAADGGTVLGNKFVPRIGAKRVQLWMLKALYGGWIPTRMRQMAMPNVDIKNDRAYIPMGGRKEREAVAARQSSRRANESKADSTNKEKGANDKNDARGAKSGGERRASRRSRKPRHPKARDENQGEAKKEFKEQNKKSDQGAESIKAMGESNTAITAN